jgi:hypothetical protein
MRALGNRVGRAAQRGVIAILLLVILVMGALYALLSNVNTATAELQQTRDDVTSVALKQAKEALIAWSATHMNGPGHLLCPDTDDDGEADTVTCGTAATRVGRLPWRTLNLPDLRDGSGERLWYAVSRCFLERSTDQYCADNYAVNSDTQGQLMVQGIAPASNVVAIIFAPGRPLAGQNRSAATKNQAVNYLEGENNTAPVAPCEYIGPFNAGTGKYDWCQDRFETRRQCEQSDCPGGPFNDQLIVITQADLFDVVENAVAGGRRAPGGAVGSLGGARHAGLLPLRGPLHESRSGRRPPRCGRLLRRVAASGGAAARDLGLLHLERGCGDRG